MFNQNTVHSCEKIKHFKVWICRREARVVGKLCAGSFQKITLHVSNLHWGVVSNEDKCSKCLKPEIVKKLAPFTIPQISKNKCGKILFGLRNKNKSIFCYLSGNFRIPLPHN